MDASLYQPLYLIVVGVLSYVTAISYISYGKNIDIYSESDKLTTQLPLVLIFGFAIALFLGGRPISGYYFGDTSNYAAEYRHMDVLTFKPDFKGEWVWDVFTYMCAKYHLTVNEWFTVVDILYVTTVIVAGAILMPKSPWAITLFIFISLSFFSYGVNGIRNGMACHILVLAIVLALRERYLLSGILAFLCIGIHHSTALPVAACVVSLFTWKIPNVLKYAICFWLFSILVSLVAGNIVTNFFSSLGFDDRMVSYAAHEADVLKFSHIGFRWDFLIYSAMPVVMCWYIAIKKQMADNWFTVLGITYCLCNAFWVMVIRSSYSNRFAYLSWFLYPFVIAYPLLNIPAWSDQGKAIGFILLAYSTFTIVMDLVYW